MIVKHIIIHNGTKTTTQDQVMNRSSRNAMNINCRIFTAQNTSKSKARSFLNAQMQIAIESNEINIKGMNARVHM